ncbi:MAG TPA: NADH-quinone oxidoreductase subunit NuoN [Chroococcales cyanobacterium]
MNLFTIDMYKQAIECLLPEICVVIAILVAAVWNLFIPKAKEFTPVFSLAGMGGAFVLLLFQFTRPSAVLFGGLFTFDKLAIGFALIATLVGMIVVLMTMGYEHHLGKNRGEFYAVLLTAVLAVMFLGGTTDLIMLFVGLETLSICCVLLTGFSKFDRKSGEASLKYLLSTAATTATLLYAISFVYGLTGSTSYSIIQEQLALMAAPPPSLLKVFILVLIMSAIGFKLSTVPFHMWTPDVYEGAPTPVTAFLSIGSKAGGFVVALRLLLVVFGRMAADWTVLITALAILSMIMGNLIALAQTSFKRMLAYSSIAHVGYILIGLTAGTQTGLSAMMFYILVYGFMNLGAFAGAILFSNETGSDNIDDMSGLMKKRPILALGMAVCLLNLAGLPIPPAGFFAKLFIFGAGIQMPLVVGNMPVGWLLVGVALVTSVPAIYYYSRVVIKMIVREPSEKVKALPEQRPFFDSPQAAPIMALALCVGFIFLAGTVIVDPMMKFSRAAVAPLVETTSPVSMIDSGLH